MFIDEDHRAPPADLPMPARIVSRDLLASCALEAARQAASMTVLDATLGAALTSLSRPFDNPASRAAAIATLAADLQQADRLRQEVEGLAGVLALLAGVDTLDTVIPSHRVLACTPFRELQHRLLLPSPSDGGATSPGGPDTPPRSAS